MPDVLGRAVDALAAHPVVVAVAAGTALLGLIVWAVVTTSHRYR